MLLSPSVPCNVRRPDQRVAVTVAAKLSKKFYDRFGEDLANELVDLLNLIATNYKSELRELNEANWTRFETRLESEMHALRSDMQAFKAEVKGELKELKAELIKWMFLFWAGTAFAGVLLRALGWTAP